MGRQKHAHATILLVIRRYLRPPRQHLAGKLSEDNLSPSLIYR